jgi:hypothetical protein
MRKLLLTGVVAAVMIPGLALAQGGAVREGVEVGGGAAGVPGAIIGGTVGAAVELPGDILGFVTGHPRRYDRVRDEVIVGRPLPREVHVYEIPRHRDYAYAYVNERRVIIEPRTRRVVRIVE